ncbi:hypothetical protein ACVXHB_20100 [Escherichia coli]
MSELTLTKPEVLTGHTDVICSTSIERIVTGRNAALAQIEVLMILDDVSMLTRSIGEICAGLGYEAGFPLRLLVDGETRSGDESYYP